MKDSAADTPETPGTPTERPSWRFSGRRGTPVHLRERTPATLPPEIRQTVTRMASEQTGDSTRAQQSTAPRAAASTTLRMPNLDRTSPPVAGAPIPVERRTRDESNASNVTTTPLESVPPPAPVPASSALEHAALEQGSLSTLPLVETLVEVEVGDEVGAESVETSAAADSPVETSAAADSSTSEAGPLEDAVASTEPTRQAASTQLTPAERRKRAKARAKARAKSRREAAKAAEDAASAGRRLFARGRDVDATVEPVAVEPAVPLAVDAPPERDADAAISTSAPSSTPTPSDSAPMQPAATLADVNLGDSTEPVLATDTQAPDARIGADSASQAAWELGRLPILLTSARVEAQTPTPPPPLAEQVEPELSIPTADGPGRMRPMQWKPIGPRPAPAPLGTPPPRRAMPDAIARLDSTLFPPRVARASRAGARESGSVMHDAATSRQRIAQRRAELDQLVASLGQLAQPGDRASH